MNFLKDKRRAGVVGIVSVLLGAAALLVGAGAAHAGFPCNDNPPPQDTHANVNDTYVGVDTSPIPSPGNPPHAWFCVAPTGGEGNQTWVNLYVRSTASGTGQTVSSNGCFSVVMPGCRAVLGSTGAGVDPKVNPNAPGGTTAGSGGSVGGGAGTCTYVNGGTPTCPLGFTVAGVTVNEADASVPTTHPNAGGCVTVGGSCVTTVPSGMGVKVLSGSSSDTVTVEVGGTTQSKDLGGCYGFNAGTGC